MGHPALDRDAELGQLPSPNLSVLFWPAKIASERSLPTLSASMSNAARELDVADVVAAEVDVHEARDLLVRVGVLVVLDALDEGRGAVADADDGDADLVLLVAPVLGHGAVPVRTVLAHEVTSKAGSGVRGPRQLAAHVPDALHDGDDGESREHIHRGLQEFHIEDAGALREHETGRQDHDADGAVGDADLALDPSASARARV